jgi:hypothetical protein
MTEYTATRLFILIPNMLQSRDISNGVHHSDHKVSDINCLLLLKYWNCRLNSHSGNRYMSENFCVCVAPCREIFCNEIIPHPRWTTRCTQTRLRNPHNMGLWAALVRETEQFLYVYTYTYGCHHYATKI